MILLCVNIAYIGIPNDYLSNGELEEDSSIESVESAEATPIESEVVNSSISSDDTLNHARDSF